MNQVDQALLAAEDLLRSLLDISKFDAGGVTPDPAPIALGPFLTELADSFRPMAADKGLALRLVNPRGTVRCDAGLLRSVLQNILSNALRYTVSGGVLIGVRRRGAFWRIDIVDSGVGIAPSQLSHIFAEFRRLGTIETEGLGLGLALVRRIVPLIGGQLDVRSRPGHGSCFSLSLPVHEDVPAPPPPIAVADAPPRPLRVLVVDDDPRIVAASTALLEALGHRAIGVRSGSEALAVTDPIDAALVD